MYLYFLKEKKSGRLLEFGYSSNGDAEFCNDVSFDLSPGEDSPWCVTSEAVANKVAVTDSPWYNAGYDSPKNPYAGNCEVIKVVVEL